VQETPGMSATESTSQNITIRLDRRTLRKAKVLAAKRNTSISGLLAQQIESLVGEDDAYEQAQRRALALLDQGFHLGGRIEATRDEWHER
jgi:predicted transcriptional regulator